MERQAGMEFYGVVVAGGKGTRLGFAKQYALLAGKPMWERSVEALAAGGVRRIWLVVPAADIDVIGQHIKDKPAPIAVTVVAGGDSRAESVANGLRELFAEVSDWSQAGVAIHDAARPFVAPQDVRAVLDTARQFGGAMLGQACVDTMKKVENGRVTGTVARAGLWHAQTPQVFRADWLQRVYASPQVELEVTDDASLIEHHGYPIHMVLASGFNGKVTTAADMEFAKWLAERKWGGQAE